MSNNPLTNQSYINKDFQTIYPELLELVKTLTYKWDPTISNESDPGVLLIKLNAIIADKNNYNIDKNILECFPDTVTQYENAYKLFTQLGYNMHWYRSSKGNISFKWDSDALKDGDGNTISLTIPQFTMVSDNDKEITFTTLQEGKISTNGDIIEVPAIQGVIRDYTIGSNTLIKPTILDYRNRLYFPIQNVAENGIFISDSKKDGNGNYMFVWDNPDTTPSAGWKPVDNLYIQPLNTKCYKFGIDQSNDTCYIEFPSDITDLMGDGIFIKYIQSDGALGNIAAKRITQFYEDLEYTIRDINGNSVKVNVSKDTKVTNYGSITNGLEPEEIDGAYTNYQKTIGTFNTLVTCRDYLNYIVKEEYEQVSNGVVTDRTNDIQSSYEIVTTKDNTTTIKPVVDLEDDSTTPQMSAFDLKTYFLDYSQWPKFNTSTNVEDQKANFKKAYDKSFKLKLNNGDNKLETSETILKLYKQAKSIEHDFIPKLAYKPLIIKNKFKLNLTIIPNNSVTKSQADDIEKTIYEAVLKQLSSKNITFGEEISYEQIYDICNNADNRVKAVALDNIEYNPYAVIYINKANIINDIVNTNDTIEHELEFKNDSGDIIKEIITLDNEYSLYDGLNEIPIPTQIPGKKITGNGEEIDRTYEDLTFNEKLALEVCAKNILKGVTPLYHPNDSFNYVLGQKNTDNIQNIDRITTFNEIEFNNISGNNNYTYMNDGGENTETNSHMLNDEALFLYAPSLIEDINYSTSIKYIYIADEKTYTGPDVNYIPANRDYILQKGQHLFMFWKTEDDEDSPYLYARYGEGTILKATTRLLSYKDKEKDLYDRIKSELLSADYQGEGQIFGELNDRLAEISSTILSTNKNIVIKKLNSVELADENNYCYWITNDIGEDPNNTSKGDQYKMTFKYVEAGNESVDVSYQNGLIYVSNFTLNEPCVNEPHELLPNEYIYILKPVETGDILYHSYNKSTETLISSTLKETNYELFGKIMPSDKIKTTWKIFNAEELFYKVNDFFNTPNTDNELPTIIPWGEVKKDKNIEKTSSGKEIKYDEVVFDDIAKLLNSNPQYILNKGCRIDKVNTLDGPNFGEEATDQETSKFEYLVKANEMFIYTDDNKKSLYILENGTKIELTVKNGDIEDKSDLIFYAPIMDKDKIYEDGEKAFTNDMWQNFNCICDKNSNGKVTKLQSGKFINIIENQLLSLGAGTNIRVKQKGIEITGYNENGELVKRNIYDSRFNNLKINSNGVHISDDGIGWLNIKGALSNYIIQYKAPENTEYITISETSNPSLGWEGYTILNINSGAKKPQYLDTIHKQQFILHTTGIDENGDYITYTLPNNEGVEQPYIQTSVNMNLQGGEQIDVTRTNIDSEITYLDAMVYDKDNEMSNQIIEKSNGEYEVTLNSENNFVESKCSIQDDTIMAIEFLQNINNIEGFTVNTLSGTSGEEIMPINVNNVVINSSIPQGTYYYKLKAIDSISFNITYGSDNDKPDVKFIIKPLFRYNYVLQDVNKDDKNIAQNILENEIKELDKYPGIQFDYIYKPLEDVKIDNPLNPKTYFNVYHKYNAFTIPQISSIQIKTMNKRV